MLKQNRREISLASFLLISLLIPVFFFYFSPATNVFAANGQSSSNFVPNQIIVKYKYGASSTQINKLQIQNNMAVVDEAKSGFKLLQLSKDTDIQQVINDLKANPAVDKVQANHILKAASVPNDPGFKDQWGLKAIKADYAWDILVTQTNIKVAVLDTGVKADHPDLAGKVVPGKNTLIDATDTTDTSDVQGHGTHVAGIIGATINNQMGVAGVAPEVTIIPVKVLGDNGLGSDWGVAEGIDYAVSAGAKVINMSLGSPDPSPIIETAVNNAVANNVLVVAAAGNESSSVSYPAAYSGAIAVSAIDNNFQFASFSNYGPDIELAAPGVDILSTYIDPTSPYVWANGTSMATPFVAGLAALVFSEDPTLSVNQVREILQLTAEDIGPAGKDDQYGHGKIDAYKAVDFGSLVLKTEQANAKVGEVVNIEINLVDINGAIKTGGTASVFLKSSDPEVLLPETAIQLENGIGTASVIFNSEGQRTISVTDAAAIAKWTSGDESSITFQVADDNLSGLQGKILLEARADAGHIGTLVEVAGNNISTTTDSNGDFFLSLAPGTYSLFVSQPGFLTKKLSSIQVDLDQVSSITEEYLSAGDLNGNNEVDLLDLVILAKAYGTGLLDEGWNSMADINYDGRVALDDLSWLAKNYGKVGDY